LINKIAAGEVIERPASVVKELVENSLDAQATRVSVLITEGGMTRIEVSDDGIGMNPDDLKLAICRHATSKLSQPEDLFNIRSFGFRGEALPSITSVSQCTIKSRSRESNSGYLIEIEGGEVKQEIETGCDYGTYISVRNLFFNTPARRKFLRSTSAEVRRIVEVVESLAIGNPQAEFVVESDGQRLFDVGPAADKFERAKQLFGASFADKFITGERCSDSLRVEVYLSKPEICRRNRSRIMILVNGRRIESKTLFASLISAYGEFLTKGIYPQGVVFVTIDPSLVDVNVHPAKSEVRFADERIIFHLLYHLVRETLLGGRALPGTSGSSRSDRASDRSNVPQPDSVRQSIRSFFDRSVGYANRSEESLSAIFAAPKAEASSQIVDSGRDQSSSTGSMLDMQTVDKFDDQGSYRMLSFNGEVRFQQLAQLYIVAIGQESILVIDQHAAHERILYELALRSFNANAITGQQLLFPLTIHLEPDDFITYNEEKESLAALGFSLSSFGPRQIQLNAIPAVLGAKNPELLLRELLDDFSDITGDSQKRYSKKAASFACRGAVMAGDRLDEPAMRALFEQLMTTENPYVCPHGRPTMIQFSKDELDVRFGRV
jgi:DNA mismatch repair protein MutL